MSQLVVKIPAVAAGGYTIHIGNGILGGVWSKLESDFPRRRKFVVTDSNVVSAGHLKTLLGGSEASVFVVDPPGETSKHINTVVSIIEDMEKGFFGRDSLIVALGGGTVGDIAGFAAAIFKRGVKVVQIPTTTVSQADSSVGGKTGVDSTVSKNAFGAFWQPSAVYIDVATLNTLDETQYRAGLVESVKHALIGDAGYFKFLKKNMEAVLDRRGDVLEKIAYTNCKIKAEVVAQDPTEQNRRRVLNFGHTIGHAVESASGFKLLHGQAVSIGIVAAELIAQEMGLAKKSRLDRIKDILKALGMPLAIPAELGKNVLIDLIKRDKKAVNQWPRFVLLKKIGKVLYEDGQWAHEVSRKVIEKTLDRLYE